MDRFLLDVTSSGKPAADVQPVACLIVVDMQAGFLTGPHAVPRAAELIAAVDELLAGARQADALVIQLRNAGPTGTPDEPGTPGWELQHPPAAGEIVIDKTLDDGFRETTLAEELQRHAIHRLAICGLMSDMCLAATARGALQRGYGVVLPHTAHRTSDIPGGPGGSPPVPAALAARAAEWSLGDEIEIVPTPTAVQFTPPRAAGALRPD